MVADEIQTGFGRTGKMFAVEHAQVTPDIMCVAKGLTGGILPLSATLATDSIYEAFLDDDVRRAFLHGHSFTASFLTRRLVVEDRLMPMDAVTELFTSRLLERIASCQKHHRWILIGATARHSSWKIS